MSKMHPGAGARLRRFSAVILVLVLALTSTRTSYGQSTDEISTHLQAVHELTQSALEHSRAAESAESVDDVKRHVDSVYAAVWGQTSGLSASRGAANFYGWKTTWQSDTTDFELETPEKFGTEPAEVTDPAKLGIMGRGLYARELLFDLQEGESSGDNPHYEHVIASLSNVIGWMRMDYADARGGMPRVDLTAQWDAPSEFWQSSSDTGWIQDAFAQALNILKTDYEGDVETARRHAADLTTLIQRALDGVDADGNASVEPAMMEGGLNIAIEHAGLAGIIQQ